MLLIRHDLEDVKITSMSEPIKCIISYRTDSVIIAAKNVYQIYLNNLEDKKLILKLGENGGIPEELKIFGEFLCI